MISDDVAHGDRCTTERVRRRRPALIVEDDLQHLVGGEIKFAVLHHRLGQEHVIGCRIGKSGSLRAATSMSMIFRTVISAGCAAGQVEVDRDSASRVRGCEIDLPAPGAVDTLRSYCHVS